MDNQEGQRDCPSVGHDGDESEALESRFHYSLKHKDLHVHHPIRKR